MQSIVLKTKQIASNICPALNAMRVETTDFFATCGRCEKQSKNGFVVLQERLFNIYFPPLYSYKTFLRRPAILRSLWNMRRIFRAQSSLAIQAGDLS